MCLILSTVRVLMCSSLFTDVFLSPDWCVNEELGIVA